MRTKKEKRPYKALDAEKDRDQLTRTEKQILQEVLEDSSPGLDKLADLVKTLKDAKKKKK
ncbi:MAG: hypothetical protein ABR951_10475 [Candidatus Aminicenantales bacterium]|jgi:hypothetical protein